MIENNIQIELSCSGPVLSDKDFVLSLSMTSALGYDDVNWLYNRLNKDKDKTKIIFAIWNQTGVDPLNYLHILNL